MMSMTGFGRSSLALAGRGHRVEVRSVNNRFLDARVRLPWPDAELESRALALVRGRVRRGRLELSVFEERGPAGAGALRLDEEAARELARALERLAELVGGDRALAATLLGPQKELTGGGPGLEGDELARELGAGIARALDALDEMRRREGETLAAHLRARLRELVALHGRIAALAADEPGQQRDRLLERIARLRGPLGEPLDPARIAEEVTLYADRCDVTEELARLGSHAAQLERMLAEEGEVGRKIEFMLQECHRELNTIASKTSAAAVAHLVVEAKTAVERMREQAQNVE